MARDEALALSVARGAKPALRVYSFDPPCITFGRSQWMPAAGELAALKRSGIDLVQRPTGGLAILHLDDFTYCLALRRSEGFGREECFAMAAAGITGALSALGVSSSVSDHESGPNGGRWCFESAYGVDIEADGLKICGSAQRVYGCAVMQHGSVLLTGRASEVLILSGQEEAGRVLMPLDKASGRELSWDEFRRAMEESFSERLGIELEPAGPDPGEVARADRFPTERTADSPNGLPS